MIRKYYKNEIFFMCIILIIILLSISPISSTNCILIYSKQNCIFILENNSINSPWPMKCHDVKHTGRSSYSTDSNNGVELWKFKTNNGVEGGAVIDDENNIYFGSWDEYIYSLYPNGTLRWKYKTGEIIWSTPIINEDRILYVGSYDAKLYALYLNGTIKWKFNAGGSISSSPVIGEDGTIYFGIMKGFDKGDVIAVTPNGEEKWRYETGYKVVSDPAIGDDGTIYIGSGDRYFYALYTNGTLRWRYRTGDIIKAPASISKDGIIYIGSFDNYLYAFYPDGTLKWKTKVGYGVETNPSLGDDGIIYIGGEHLYAIYPNGTIKWTFNLGSNRHIHQSSASISSDGTIFVGTNIGETSGGEIIAVYKNGTERWRIKIANSWVESSPCIGMNGTVYIGSSSRDNFGNFYGYIYAIGEGELPNNPPDQPTISGSSSGKAGNIYNYTIFTTDQEGDEISYFVDWGDDSFEGWTRLLPSGEEYNVSHIWEEEGRYIIRVKAKDNYDNESEWSTLEVSMPKSNKMMNMLFTKTSLIKYY